MCKRELEIRVMQHISRWYVNYNHIQIISLLEEVEKYINKKGMPKSVKDFKKITKVIDNKAQSLNMNKLKRKEIEYKIDVTEIPNKEFKWEVIERRLDNVWCNAGVGISKNRGNAVSNAIDFAETVLV